MASKEIETILSYMDQLKIILQKDFKIAKDEGDRPRATIALEKWKSVDAMNLWIRANINGEDIFKIN